jgi:cytochrome c oxidase subunit III
VPAALHHGDGGTPPHPAEVRSLVAYRGRARGRQDATARVGMLVFMGAWLMLFAALFFVYGAVRARAPAWPPPGAPRLPRLVPGLATAVLAASSVLVGSARRALQAGRPRAAGGSLGLGAALGAAFLVMQAAVWSDLWRAGLVPSGGPYPSVFYGLTTLHGLHVLVGLAALAILAARAAAGRAAPLRVELWGLYWHGVGAVWLALYAAVYLT